MRGDITQSCDARRPICRSRADILWLTFLNRLRPGSPLPEQWQHRCASRLLECGKRIIIVSQQGVLQ